MIFPYTRFDVAPSLAFLDNHVALRPIALIMFEHQEVRRRYKALVDSGADFCIFHSLIGELLGLKIEDGKEANFSGIGEGGMRAYFHTVKIHIGDYSYDLYCGFTRDIPADGYGILGQVGFFDHFKVVFDQQQEEIEIIAK